MPALADRMTSQVDMSGYTPVDKPTPSPMGGIPNVNLEPGLNVYLRCPIPPVWSTTSDTLRQYYRKDAIPQTRLFNPPNPGLNSGGSTTNITNVSSTNTSGSGGSGTSSIAPTQISLKTTLLGPNIVFTGSFDLSKSFQLLSLNSTSPCRVQIYGTALAQLGDSYRGLDVPPPAGTAQNIICDVVLDTAPFQWTFQDRIGANADSPITSRVYVSITNLDTTSDVVSLTIGYVPLAT